MRTSPPIQLVVHFPQTEDGRQELARRVADVHASFVISTIRNLNCSANQKLELLQTVIDSTKGIYHPP